MARRFAVLLALLAVAALAGCAAGGPKHAEIKSTIAPLAPDTGRIYFYRESSPFGAAVQPEIKLNSDTVGRSVPGGFFFVDRAPGTYVVSVMTEVENTTSFELKGGQTCYVKTTVSMGILVGRVTPSVTDPGQGEADLTELSYIGTPLPAQPAQAGRAPASPSAAAPAGPVQMDDLQGLLPAGSRR